MSWWNPKKKEASTHPVDTRLEIVSDGLSAAAVELQNFVVLLNKRYAYSVVPTTPKPGSGGATLPVPEAVE